MFSCCQCRVDGVSPPHALYARSQLKACSAAIDAAVGCLACYSRAHPQEAVRVPQHPKPFASSSRPVFGWCDRCGQRTVPLSELLVQWARLLPVSALQKSSIAHDDRPPLTGMKNVSTRTFKGVINALSLPTRPIPLLSAADEIGTSYRPSFSIHKAVAPWTRYQTMVNATSTLEYVIHNSNFQFVHVRCPE